MKWLGVQRTKRACVVPCSALVAVTWFSACPLCWCIFYLVFVPLGYSPPWPGGQRGITAVFTADRCGSRRESAAGARRGSPGGTPGRGFSAASPGGWSGAEQPPCPGRRRGGREAVPGERDFPGGQPGPSPPWPAASRRWRCRRSPGPAGPALPRLGRGNDLRGNLGRAGRERGRAGGARDAPEMPRRPEDTAGAAGRSVGAAPGSPCPSRGHRGAACPGIRCPGALRHALPAGLGRGGCGGSRGAPVPRAGGVSALGVPPAARRGWNGAGGAPGDAQGWQWRLGALLPLLAVAGARPACPSRCDPGPRAGWSPAHQGHLPQPRQSPGQLVSWRPLAEESLVPTHDAVPSVTRCHQPFRKGGPGSRISGAGAARLVLPLLLRFALGRVIWHSRSKWPCLSLGSRGEGCSGRGAGRWQHRRCQTGSGASCFAVCGAELSPGSCCAVMLLAGRGAAGELRPLRGQCRTV